MRELMVEELEHVYGGGSAYPCKKPDYKKPPYHKKPHYKKPHHKKPHYGKGKEPDYACA